MIANDHMAPKLLDSTKSSADDALQHDTGARKALMLHCDLDPSQH